MRDGIMLAANIWRPKAKGKFPVIYLHIAYDKSNTTFVLERVKYFVPRGYAFVAIDNRGRYDSDGVPYFYWHTDWRNGGFEGQDVQDSLNWIGEQQWCSGKIGMTGPSYLGFVQWMGATLGSPYLAALIPYVTPDDHYDNVYPGGAFQLTNSMHCLAFIGGSRTNNSDLEPNFFDWNKTGSPPSTPDFGQRDAGKEDRSLAGLHRSSRQRLLLALQRRRPASIRRDGQRPLRTSQSAYPQHHGLVRPGLAGHDQQLLGHGQLRPQRDPQESPADRRPLEHNVGQRKIGDLDYGPLANVEYLPKDLAWRAYWLKGVELRWYDYWLKGVSNGVMDEAPVNIFVMAENRWRTETEWPLSRAVETKYYLHSGGRANTGAGDGVLNPDPPDQEPHDGFVFDPENPVPTIGCIQPWQGFGIPKL